MPTGAAVLTWNPDTKVITAAIDARGFTPGSSHAVHIHPGSCADQTQPPSVPFPDVSADDGGAIKQTVVSHPVPAGIPDGSYLNIHLAPSAQLGTPSDMSFTPIACGDIPGARSSTDPVTLTMNPPTKDRIRPTGTATLTYNNTNHTLQVTVAANGLPPGTAHAVHIHSGSCATQGEVAYPLPDLQVNNTGDASLSTTLDNVATPPPATGWYLNVHTGPASQILTGNTPTLLFAPILCGNIEG